MHCPACQQDNRQGRRFCAACGAPLALVCPACGTENETHERFCGQCGAVLVGNHGPQLETLSGAAAPRLHFTSEAGERRQLTVLFCDLVGSTELSAQFDAEEWRYIVAGYQRSASETVQKFGGHVAKYLGDGLLVLFGYPQADDLDAERAVRAGLALVGAQSPLTAAAAANPLHPQGGAAGAASNALLHVRVGIHTGPTVIGTGAGDTPEVFGETPNIAARLQAAAAPDSVVLSGATLRLVRGIFVIEELVPQRLKGMAEPLQLYRAVQPSGVRSRLDVAAGHLSPFVGREVELATLLDRWDRAVDGEGQNVLVVGEAGVGKSRLVYQLRERLTSVPHTWLECRGTPYTEGTPFHPVIELVQQGLAFTAADTVAVRVGKIERALALAGLDPSTGVPLVSEFLGVGTPEHYSTPPVSPELRRRRIIELLVAWNLALAEAQPLVVVVEDLHWCDLSSVELLGRLIEQSPTARVLLVGTARPEFTVPWAERSHLTRIKLTRLTKRQARELVVALGGDELPPEMLDTLVARADGVPLYVEELTKAVVEPGVAHQIEAIPATLADSLMARLDRLSAAKEVAQQAAVLGREFSFGLLEAVARIDAAALQRALRQLVEAEILFARGEPPAATYTFKHMLVQEAAYESLLKRVRRELHGRVLRALEERFPARTVAEPEVAARHAAAAGLAGEAVTYYARAAAQAQGRSAHEEAIAQLHKALELLGTLPAGPARDAREVDLQIALGASLVPTRGYGHGETAQAYERARVLCEAVGDAAGVAAAFVGLSIFYSNRGELERGITLAERVLAAGEEGQQPSLLLLGHTQCTFPKHFQGSFAASLAHAERGMLLYDPGRDHPVVFRYGTDQGVVSFAFGAWNLWHLGYPDQALVRVREGVALARTLGHPFSLALGLFFETALHWFRRDLAAQRQYALEVIALSESQGFPLWLGLGHAAHGLARVLGGEGAAALDELSDGLALAAGTGNQSGAPALLLMLAEGQWAAGAHAAVVGTVESALEVATQTGQHFWDAELHRLKGEVMRADGQSSRDGDDDAERCFQRALDIASSQGSRALELRAAMSLGRLHRDRGKCADARTFLAARYTSFAEGLDTGDLRAAGALLRELG